MDDGVGPVGALLILYLTLPSGLRHTHIMKMMMVMMVAHEQEVPAEWMVGLQRLARRAAVLMYDVQGVNIMGFRWVHRG